MENAREKAGWKKLSNDDIWHRLVAGTDGGGFLDEVRMFLTERKDNLELVVGETKIFFTEFKEGFIKLSPDIKAKMMNRMKRGFLDGLKKK